MAPTRSSRGRWASRSAGASACRCTCRRRSRWRCTSSAFARGGSGSSRTIPRCSWTWRSSRWSSAIAYVSAELAFRIQYVVMAVIAVSLVAVLGNIDVWQSSDADRTGRGVSGRTRDRRSRDRLLGGVRRLLPRRHRGDGRRQHVGRARRIRGSIPVGTLSAIAISMVIYIAARRLVRQGGTTDELTSQLHPHDRPLALGSRRPRRPARCDVLLGALVPRRRAPDPGRASGATARSPAAPGWPTDRAASLGGRCC